MCQSGYMYRTDYTTWFLSKQVSRCVGRDFSQVSHDVGTHTTCIRLCLPPPSVCLHINISPAADKSQPDSPQCWRWPCLPLASQPLFMCLAPWQRTRRLMLYVLQKTRTQNKLRTFREFAFEHVFLLCWEERQKLTDFNQNIFFPIISYWNLPLPGNPLLQDGE